jgi:2-polyprenyl-3-methyl-5-hydroxy-6-metoxy-1,4-benzoquinol methylase
MNPWYKELFEDYAETYEREIYVVGTLGEVDFIEQEIAFNKTCRILDIGCGTGRHDLELAKRGYSVTGVDLSAAMLNKARQKAQTAGVQIDFRQGDACDLTFNQEFDLAIMLCGGAFPLMESDEKNFAILQGAVRALKPGGKFILTTLNGLFPLDHSIREFMASGTLTNFGEKEGFDRMTFRYHSQLTFQDDSGKSHDLQCNERYYLPSEMSWLLKSLSFEQIQILGCRMGQWSKELALSPDHFEMLVVATLK